MYTVQNEERVVCELVKTACTVYIAQKYTVQNEVRVVCKDCMYSVQHRTVYYTEGGEGGM